MLISITKTKIKIKMRKTNCPHWPFQSKTTCYTHMATLELNSQFKKKKKKSLSLTFSTTKHSTKDKV